MRTREAVLACFKKYAVFGGRASLSEYWRFSAFAMGGFGAVAGAIALARAAGWVSEDAFEPALMWGAGLWWGVMLIPQAAVGSRRLRDTGKSGWWMLAHATPSGHWLALWLCAQPGESGPNRFGDPPEAGEPGGEGGREERGRN